MRVRAWDAHWRGGNLDAIRLCNELIKIAPNPGLVYSYRAAAYFELNDCARAIEDCNKALELQPNYAPALKLLASLHVKANG